MLNNILSKYPHNINIKVGDDGRYHTVYYLEFETGQFYIGKHTTDNLSNDPYVCSSKLAHYLIEHGLKYHRTVMYYLQSSKDAIKLETSILSNQKYYDHPDNINCYPGSPPDATGTVVISKNNKFKMINPLLLEMYLSQGWEQKGVKRIWINNGVDSKMILPDDLPSYLSNGWITGNALNNGRIFIVKELDRKYIKKTFLDEYLQNGWVVKHNVTGTKVLRKDGKIIKVQPDQVEKYQLRGYVNSSTVDGLLYIKRGNEYKRVTQEELPDYLSSGWTKGNNTSGKSYITNGQQEIRISLDDLSNYPGWTVGRIPKIYLNNGIIEKRIWVCDSNKIDQYLTKGFVLGKLSRPKKIRMYRGTLSRFTTLNSVSRLESEGWTTVYEEKVSRATTC